MNEGRKRVLGIMAAILTAMHMRTASDLFGTPSGSSETDKLIAASVQWERIMRKIDNAFSAKDGFRCIRRCGLAMEHVLQVTFGHVRPYC